MPHWPRWTIILPGSAGCAVGALLGTLGWFSVSFGQATICTDFNEGPHACDGLNAWLEAGFFGQWVLVLASAILLAVGLRRPQSRRPVSIAAWITSALAIAWFGFCYYGAYHSFKVHA